jgi:hypothetical protein
MMSNNNNNEIVRGLAAAVIGKFCPFLKLQGKRYARTEKEVSEVIAAELTPFFHRMGLVRQTYDDMLVAEVKRHGGIPHLTTEELTFREALSAFLL